MVKDMNGEEKWDTKIDYADSNNWLAINYTGKAVDVVYFYPTTFIPSEEGASIVADIDDAGMRSGAQEVYESQATLFEGDCNIYAPYYRQVDATYALTLSPEGEEDLLRRSAAHDPSDALDHYFEHYNDGRPFILAGHSQGSEVLTMILSDYMTKHPELLDRMVAAYVIGYSVTERYIAENPHLRFAECADDTGVIISYNTEGPGNDGFSNAVVKDGAISINPINWKRDGTYADRSEGLGSRIGGVAITGLVDAKVDLERGVVVCTTVDPSDYAIPAPADKIFGPESYHKCDYEFYYYDLRENVKNRIAAFMDQ